MLSSTTASLYLLEITSTLQGLDLLNKVFTNNIDVTCLVRFLFKPRSICERVRGSWLHTLECQVTDSDKLWPSSCVSINAKLSAKGMNFNEENLKLRVEVRTTRLVPCARVFDVRAFLTSQSNAAPTHIEAARCAATQFEAPNNGHYHGRWIIRRRASFILFFSPFFNMHVRKRIKEQAVGVTSQQPSPLHLEE